MIEKIVRDFLTAGGFPAVLEMPERYAPPLVVIEKTAASETETIMRATLAVQSYGASLYAAAQLSRLVRRRMEALNALPEISNVNMNSEYNYTDTETKRYRYQAVFDVVYYDDAED